MNVARAERIDYLPRLRADNGVYSQPNPYVMNVGV